ncbi:MAG: RHS repeat-associated core domain-containing protein, partial [Christensenellaceae bacterium]
NASTGTINLRARQYEPAMMRFSQMDILRGKDSDPNSLNRYLYCQNDPVNFVDLDGLQMQFNATAKQIEQWVRKNPTVPLMKSTKETYKKAIKQTQKTGTASAKKWAEGKSEDTLTQIAVESIVAQEDLKRIDAGITNSQDYFAQLLKDVKGNENVSQSQIDSIMKKAQADINAAGGVKKLSVYDINKIMLAACGGVKGSVNEGNNDVGSTVTTKIEKKSTKIDPFNIGMLTVTGNASTGFKTTEGSKGKTITIDNSIKISENGMTSYTGLTAIINNFLTISKDKVGIKIGSISVKVGGATSATNENGLNVIFDVTNGTEYGTVDLNIFKDIDAIKKANETMDAGWEKQIEMMHGPIWEWEKSGVPNSMDNIEAQYQWKYFQEAVVEGFKNTCEWMPLPIPGGIPVIQ